MLQGFISVVPSFLYSTLVKKYPSKKYNSVSPGEVEGSIVNHILAFPVSTILPNVPKDSSGLVALFHTAHLVLSQ